MAMDVGDLFDAYHDRKHRGVDVKVAVSRAQTAAAFVRGAREAGLAFIVVGSTRGESDTRNPARRFADDAGEIFVRPNSLPVTALGPETRLLRLSALKAPLPSPFAAAGRDAPRSGSRGGTKIPYDYIVFIGSLSDFEQTRQVADDWKIPVIAIGSRDAMDEPGPGTIFLDTLDDQDLQYVLLAYLRQALDTGRRLLAQRNPGLGFGRRPRANPDRRKLERRLADLSRAVDATEALADIAPPDGAASGEGTPGRPPDLPPSPAGMALELPAEVNAPGEVEGTGDADA